MTVNQKDCIFASILKQKFWKKIQISTTVMFWWSQKRETPPNKCILKAMAVK